MKDPALVSKTIFRDVSWIGITHLNFTASVNFIFHMTTWSCSTVVIITILFNSNSRSNYSTFHVTATSNVKSTTQTLLKGETFYTVKSYSLKRKERNQTDRDDERQQKPTGTNESITQCG